MEKQNYKLFVTIDIIFIIFLFEFLVAIADKKDWLKDI